GKSAVRINQYSLSELAERRQPEYRVLKRSSAAISIGQVLLAHRERKNRTGTTNVTAREVGVLQ
ncbi:hypothetical protein, partial [Burkholderia cenocepacia]|uniref:hypothetical protein n=1 Tax=Burkholderia cenocepacia TaxID=95486 RepID=UPI001E2BCF5E